jgi:Ca2+-binding EF-hand superfamily protein
MSKRDSIFQKILNGTSDGNIPFETLVNLLKSLGFEMRIKGSHHIFYMNGIDEIINLQAKGNKAKNYQVEQVRKLILKYKLKLN